MIRGRRAGVLEPSHQPPPKGSAVSVQVPVSTDTGTENRPAPQAAGGLRGSIRRNPLTWFFTLAFALSWAAWTPYVLSENGLGVWHFAFPGSGGATQLTGVLPGAYLGRQRAQEPGQCLRGIPHLEGT